MSERVPNWPSTGTTSYTDRLRIKCSSCQAVEDIGDTTLYPPSKARQVVERRGWRVSKKWKHAKCLECRRKRAAEQAADDAMTNGTQSRGLRRTILLLEEHFDEQAKPYEAGWSDERIAKEIGMSEDFIAGVRENCYGPLEDPRIAELRELLTTARQQLDREVSEIEQMLKAVREDAARRIDELGTELAQLQRK